MHPTTANHSSRGLGRSEKERLRRAQMKNLYSRLASVLPPPLSKEKLAMPALLDLSLKYVKSLKERNDKLKSKKEKLEGLIGCAGAPVVPTMVVHESGSTLEVNLVNGLNKKSIFIEALKILEEEGAQVVRVRYATSGGCMRTTIHSQAFSSRIGIDTSNVIERLKTLLALNTSPHQFQ